MPSMSNPVRHVPTVSGSRATIHRVRPWDLLSFLADYVRIFRSGLFMHSAYALRYLGTRRAICLSLVHYLWSGEKSGYRPNPFFDPAQAGFGLSSYLRTPSLWSTPPSPFFDPAFYARANPQPGPPLVHFWRIGFQADRNPSADFDLRFFKDVVAFHRRDHKEFAFEGLSDPRRWVPGTETAFRVKQAAFYADVKLKIVRRHAGPRRRFLALIQADQSFDSSFLETQRSFDVLVNDYGGLPTEFCPAIDYVTAQGGTKTTAIRKLLEEAPDILLAYEYVLFLDDDVVLTSEAIDRLFAVAVSEGLDLAQASLTPTSFCAFEILKQPKAGSSVMPLTAVEIMMPVISRRALVTCGWVFGEAISGWAVDFLLGVEVRRHFGETIALIGDVVAAHERGVDTQDGAFYRFLRSKGIEATTELGLIRRRFGIDVSVEAIRPCRLLSN